MYNIYFWPRFGLAKAINDYQIRVVCVRNFSSLMLINWIRHTKPNFGYKITFWICVLVLLIHKGNFIVKELVWNVCIKAFWYTKTISNYLNFIFCKTILIVMRKKVKVVLWFWIEENITFKSLWSLILVILFIFSQMNWENEKNKNMVVQKLDYLILQALGPILKYFSDIYWL